MTRVLVSGDHHWDARSRWDECVRIHDWMAELAHEQNVDLFISTGDVFERKSEPSERRAVAAWLQRVAEQCPVLIVRGNHDALGDLPLFERLQTRHPIVVEEGAGVHRLAGLPIAALAWPRRAALEQMWRDTHGRSPTADEAATAAREAMRMTLTGMRGASLLAAHAMVSGSLTSTGQPLVGCDMEIGLDDLRAVGCPVVLGHIHKPQEWLTEKPGDDVIYTGSPRRTAFGEVESKSVVMLDFDAVGLRDWQRIETPCAPMLLLEGTIVDHSECSPHREMELTECPEFDAGAEIRLRYEVTGEERVFGRREAEQWRDTLLSRGASRVVLEERVTATSTARAPEVSSRASTNEKLRLLWEVRGEDIEEARVERLFGVVGELEEEVV